jgi:hypothetical protein
MGAAFVSQNAAVIRDHATFWSMASNCISQGVAVCRSDVALGRNGVASCRHGAACCETAAGVCRKNAAISENRVKVCEIDAAPFEMGAAFCKLDAGAGWHPCAGPSSGVLKLPTRVPPLITCGQNIVSCGSNVENGLNRDAPKAAPDYDLVKTQPDVDSPIARRVLS